jgi:hypothetical protein
MLGQLTESNNENPAQEKNQNHFKKLPPHIIGHVFSFFRVSDVRTLSFVCRDWKVEPINEALPELICNQVSVTPNQLVPPPRDLQGWQNAYHELRRRENEEKKINQLTENINKNAGDIQETEFSSHVAAL